MESAVPSLVNQVSAQYLQQTGIELDTYVVSISDGTAKS